MDSYFFQLLFPKNPSESCIHVFPLCSQAPPAHLAEEDSPPTVYNEGAIKSPRTVLPPLNRQVQELKDKKVEQKKQHKEEMHKLEQDNLDLKLENKKLQTQVEALQAQLKQIQTVTAAPRARVLQVKLPKQQPTTQEVDLTSAASFHRPTTQSGPETPRSAGNNL
eukprot:TRINITY_DN67790_c0_g4_i1.p1 TRINITY_DN67790_c0_g4~~TRINITY_DN67790_c0_g4_i1.p1  ORF type:complete len:165 (+),score=20.07 TRINITY_DN67790_c0_g4_i1:1-495(+)